MARKGSNAGGAAASGGIDFQNRFVAIVLAHMLSDMSAIDILDISDEQSVESLACETTDAIDDLKITTTSGVIFVQAKKTISLSDRLNSEFSSVLLQFVRQHQVDSGVPESYVLATTTGASSRITRELRKMTIAARLNRAGEWEKTLNESERKTLKTTRGLIGKHIQNVSGRVASDGEIAPIFEKIRISVVDIDPGSPLERALFVLLGGKATMAPELLWAALISLSGHLASNRLAIDQRGLSERLGHYVEELVKERNQQRKEILQVELKGKLSSGREVVLAEFPRELSEETAEKFTLRIMEFYRFDGSGAKRLRFADGHVHLPNGISAKVLCRASSYQGLQRYLSGHPELFKDKNVILMPIKGDQDNDSTPYALAYGAHCEQLYLEDDNDLACIYCGEPISESGALMIEIDEEKRSQAVGNVHGRCLQPLHRILGRMEADLFDDYSLLVNFDYRAWFQAMQKGQGLFSGLHEGMESNAVIAWNPRYNKLSRGEWCIRVNLDDGSSRYVHERGRVTRESHQEAEQTAASFNDSFAKQKKAKDPWTYTSLREAFAPYSINMRTKLPEETCIRCLRAEAARFTQDINEAYSRVDSFYTPLLYLVDPTSGKPLILHGGTILLSNPLAIAMFHRNWTEVWPDFPAFTVASISADAEFDKFMAEQLGKGIQVVIDPLFDLEGSLVMGYPVVNYEEVVSQRSADS